MDTSGQAAETMVKYSLEGMEYTLKIAGSGAERLAAILMAAAKDQQKTKGRTTMKALLKSEKELTVFTIPDDRLRDFAKEAKRYGVLFCVVKEKKPRPDALSDILVKAEDAAKINRIIERLGLGQVDILENAPEVVELTADEQAAQNAEEILAQIIQEPEKEGKRENPPAALAEILPQSEPSFVPSVEDFNFSFENDTEIGILHLDESVFPNEPEQRPSVRAALAQIRQEQFVSGLIGQNTLSVDQQLDEILGKDSEGVSR